MTATLIFMALALAGAGFMIRFLIAICGPERTQAKVAVWAQSTPVHNRSEGEEPDRRDGRFSRGEGRFRYVIPIDVFQPGPGRAALRSYPPVRRGRTANGD